MSDKTVSKTILEKLRPDEKYIDQLDIFNETLVATDQRIIRFTHKGYDVLEYSDISGVERKMAIGRKIFGCIFIPLVGLILVLISWGVWNAYLDTTVRNVSFSDALILSIICGSIAIASSCYAFLVTPSYYQLLSPKIDKKALKFWRITRSPWSGKRVDTFFNVVLHRIKGQ